MNEILFLSIFIAFALFFFTAGFVSAMVFFSNKTNQEDDDDM
jgi:hypothetical protein